MCLERADEGKLAQYPGREIINDQDQSALELHELFGAEIELLSIAIGNHKTAVTQTLIVIWQDECLQLLAFG